MQSTWANPEKIGVIVIRDGVAVYLDAGPEYEAAVAAVPAEYSGPLDLVDPGAVSLQPAFPATVGRLALRVALAELGRLEAVEAAVASGPVAVRMAWDDPNAVFSPDGIVARFVAETLGVSVEGVHDVFQKANDLRF